MTSEPDYLIAALVRHYEKTGKHIIVQTYARSKKSKPSRIKVFFNKSCKSLTPSLLASAGKLFNQFGPR